MLHPVWLVAVNGQPGGRLKPSLERAAGAIATAGGKLAVVG